MKDPAALGGHRVSEGFLASTTQEEEAPLRNAPISKRKTYPDMTNNLSDTRIQLITQGYTPLPNRGKQTFLKAWPSLVIDEAVVRSWDTGQHARDRSTGIRLDPPLAMIDLDCGDERLRRMFWARAQRVLPQLGQALERGRTGSAKVAWLVRAKVPFVRKASHVWQKVDGQIAQLELHGGGRTLTGGASRQMGAFGPHSPHSDYLWKDGRSPLTVPVVELVELPEEAFGSLGDIFDEVAGNLFWAKINVGRKSDEAAELAFDLVDSMQFHMQGGGLLSLDELSQEAEAHDGSEGYLRCDASAFRRESDNRSVCSVTWHHSHGVRIYDFATGIAHHRQAADPERGFEELAELLPTVAPPGGGMFGPGPQEKQKRHDEAVAMLLRDYAHYPNEFRGQGGVVGIKSNDRAGGGAITLKSMAVSLMPCDMEVRGPRGAVRRVSPVTTWCSMPERVEVAGLRMRPDMPHPLYEEHGRRWINTYEPPDHPLGGSTVVWARFMQHLFPSPIELRWFLSALAHKVQKPWIPGPCIILVAEEYGTGRGTLFAILSKLFGVRFVTPIGFDLITGTSGSARFNDWEAESLLVTIDEAATPQEDYTSLRTRRMMYESLKQVVDPASERDRRFEPKGKKAFYGRPYATYLIATNHRDALELPADDRRFAVLENGRMMPVALANMVHAWQRQPENIGALYRELQGMTVNDSSPFQPFEVPPMFAGREAMIDASGSPLSEAIDEALRLLHPAFTLRQVEIAIELDTDTGGFPESWRLKAAQAVRSKCRRCGAEAVKFRTGGGRRQAAYTNDYTTYKSKMAEGVDEMRAWVRNALETNESTLRGEKKEHG
jgi:Family of unknown function (DUF5906)